MSSSRKTDSPFSVSPSSFSERSRSSNLLSDRTCTTEPDATCRSSSRSSGTTRSFHPTSATSTRGTSTGIVSSRRRPVSPAARRSTSWGVTLGVARSLMSESAVWSSAMHTTRSSSTTRRSSGGASTTLFFSLLARPRTTAVRKCRLTSSKVRPPQPALSARIISMFWPSNDNRSSATAPTGGTSAHRTNAASTTVAARMGTNFRSPPTRSKTCVDCDRRNSAINLDLGADGSALRASTVDMVCASASLGMRDAPRMTSVSAAWAETRARSSTS
mmetsp:Transcript_18832/g.56187  ORF Transcript_18832/g.56187 Transcript_18832/m.56187 type:complete len:274 (+) Transcript_18832:858-1679(+)